MRRLGEMTITGYSILFNNIFAGRGGTAIYFRNTRSILVKRVQTIFFFFFFLFLRHRQFQVLFLYNRKRRKQQHRH